MKINKLMISLSVGFIVLSTNVFAASTLNNNFRILEDTLWLICFTLMIIFGLLMTKMSSGKTMAGYYVLAAAGLSGWLWKGIGLVKRVFIQKEPVWLFDIARETFEGFTGIILAIGFILIVYSMMKIFKKK